MFKKNIIKNKKKITSHLVVFAVPADHFVKMKESKKLTNTWTFSEN